MVDYNDIFDKITEDIIIDIMEEFGSPVMNRGSSSSGEKYIVFKTVCHGGTSSKLYYYIESKTFYCYTNCGFMTIPTLISKLNGYKESEFGQVVKYLSDKIGISCNNRVGFKTSESVKRINQSISEMDKRIQSSEYYSKKAVEINKFYDERILNYFDNKTFYGGWIDEGISIESMQKFNIRWYEYEKHIIIPHFNINGKLVGIRRRSLKPEDSKNKYMPEFIDGQYYEHPLGLNLYGIYENQDAIRKKKRAIIVEGEKSVLLSDTYYGKNSVTVATCGFHVSDWQLQQLLKLGVKEVYLGFDKDFDTLKEKEYNKSPDVWKEYQNYLNRLNSIAEKMSVYCSVYLLIDKKNLLKVKDSPFD